MSIDGVTNLWDELFGAQPDPPALLVLVTVFMGWFSAFVVYRLYRGRSAS